MSSGSGLPTGEQAANDLRAVGDVLEVVKPGVHQDDVEGLLDLEDHRDGFDRAQAQLAEADLRTQTGAVEIELHPRDAIIDGLGDLGGTGNAVGSHVAGSPGTGAGRPESNTGR